MQHFYGLQDVSYKDAWLTIGAFDGFHIGHQRIINKLTAGAHKKGVPAVVLTFYPHPSRVIYGPSDSFYLTMPERKASLLGMAGVDAVITYPFDATTALMSADDFVDKLCEHLNFTQLWIGYDFAFGHNREGDTQMLRDSESKYGYELNSIDAFKFSGEIVSSTRIRGLIKSGQVLEAAELLGRPHSVNGIVTRGDGRGKTIGVPTANLATHKSLIVPKEGVYACEVEIENQRYRAVTNVGRRPTFETEPVPSRVETFILDFDQDIYGTDIRVEFIKRLRDEQKFSGIDELIKQIGIDIEITKRFFEDQE
jgi:riboflavin kinase/FMN adenylyltransferase